MAGRLAILAGRGALPGILAGAVSDAVHVTFSGIAVGVPAGTEHLPTSFERLGELFSGLAEKGVTDVVFAGSMSRPALDPSRFDATMHALAPRLMMAMGQGDDSLLRTVADVFEEKGFAVKGAHEILPDLLLARGSLIGPEPGKGDLDDATRAATVLDTLSPLDVGQAAVVAGGMVMGIETIQGTDAMLRFVGNTPAALWRKRGVLVKQPKAGQDLRFDMPVVGPATLRNAAAAGIGGVVVAAQKVLVLDQPAIRQITQDNGIFLLAR